MCEEKTEVVEETVEKLLVSKGKIKEFVKALGCRTSSDVVLAVDAKVKEMLGEAVGRCGCNKRQTVQAYDL